MAEEKKRGGGQMDPELKAIQRCLREIKDLPPQSKINVCQYLMERARGAMCEPAPQQNVQKRATLFT
jgi:hypothetical protein